MQRDLRRLASNTRQSATTLRIRADATDAVLDWAAMSPDELKRRFAALLDDAGLPHWTGERHRPEIEMLELSWAHGGTFTFDLTRSEIEPLDEGDRRLILDIPLWGDADHEPHYFGT